MKIFEITDFNDINQNDETVLVLGYFDALHKGHQKLFIEARKLADKNHSKVALITFKESPKVVFAPYEETLLKHVHYPEKRYAKMAEFGVDYLYLMDFTSRFSKTSALDFIKTYINKLNATGIVVGFDYRFGSDLQDSSYLQRHFSGQVVIVDPVEIEGIKISSSWIKELIASGQVSQVNKLLGFPLSTRGIVSHGEARGRTIGYPTANLAMIDRTFVPTDGVYVTDVIVQGKKYRSMTSVGKNITFDGQESTIEIHIFDFNGDIYGEPIELFWLEKIREMIRFSGIDALVVQLQMDEKIAKNW
ncbi:bifunctional riboflavin kinase/FAD synthetase [Streptococcus zalophi]|uniref:Riboflavin biosynthesis protein n=1 Tax=Streptococcus zalophi TaxID=640031 RepID=A0A934P9G9_9STRE|nr:bifunctional riboflavin kinase/FAD synthetase [Streptococcus zalophi]MBJ8349524.1 bifunctional riboflavin kinase/FAD synthetase [Streptococcus zalophi]MCR8967281.1 bifunctional riboflavin kinase/FAD synthetase [Streptococcus zalophi]